MYEFQDPGGPIYALILLFVVWSLYRAHRNQAPGYKEFNLLDLLMENGHVSKISVAFLVTLFTSSWYIVHEALEKQLTDTGFAAYLASWVAPIIARVIKGSSTSGGVAPTPVPVAEDPPATGPQA